MKLVGCYLIFGQCVIYLKLFKFVFDRFLPIFN